MVGTALNRLIYHPYPWPPIICTFAQLDFWKKEENQDHLWKWSRLNHLWWSTSHRKKKINPDFDCGVRNLWLFHFLLLTKISLSWFYGIWCTICIFNVIDKSTLIRFYVFCATAKLSCELCSEYFCCFFLKNAYSVLNLKIMSFHI